MSTPDNLDPEEIDPSTSDGRTVSFHHELNNFICNRSEEWDLNPYELVGVLLTELFEQLKWATSDDDEFYDDDENDDDDDDDEDDDEF